MSTIPEALALALRHHKAGELEQAQTIYQQILQTEPAQAEALHFLGLIAHQVGKPDLAVAYMKQSLTLKPYQPGFYCNLGLAYLALRDFDQAAACLRQALRLRPDYVEALSNLANVLKAQGKLDEAAAHHEQVLRLRPDDVQTHNNLGNVLLDLNNLEQAIVHYREALRLNPRHALAHSNLGNALKKLGQLDEAVASFKQALVCRPDYAEAHNNLASALQDQGHVEQALASYRQALRCQPDLAVAHLNLANLLRSQGRLAEAIVHLQQADQLQPELAQCYTLLGSQFQALGQLDDAIAAYRQALALRPDLVEAHNNLGNVLSLRGKAEEAAACYQQVLRLKPECAEAWFNLGAVFSQHKQLEQATTCFGEALRLQPQMADAHIALGELLGDQVGKVDEAIACLQQALHYAPSDRLRIALATRLPVVYRSLTELDSWRRRLIEEVGQLRERQVVLDLTDEPVANTFYLAYQGLNDRDIQRQIAALYRPPEQIALEPRAIDGKISVGLISSFFMAQTIGHWMRGLVANLSRADFAVTVLAIANQEDDITAFIKQHADHYVSMPKHLPSARQLIADQKLDVLLYADIGMDPFTSTLAFSRLAPVQCVTLGHPETTGIDAIDYFLSTEDLETDNAQDYYTETLVKLKKLPIHYYRPQPTSPLQDRAHFGLAKEDHVYACLQSLFKFHPDFDELLAGILRGDPRGVLVLTRWLVPHAEHLLRQRFAATMPDVVNRIRFFPMLSYADYLSLLAIADVQLDPVRFGGGNTSYDAFAVGTPIVTMPTKLLRGRITYALYKQMGILDCVAKNPREYIDMVLRLGTDTSHRQALRSKILAAHGALYERSEGIRDLEQFLRQTACGLAR